jgi:hypothetical protein
MRIFETPKNGKINFVDLNDTYVGMDYTDYCCENFGFFFTREKPSPTTTKTEAVPVEDLDLEPYFFDSYFAKFGCSMGTDGGMAFFRLRANEETLYLCLYNHHNGYYSHGFTMKQGGEDGESVVDGKI